MNLLLRLTAALLLSFIASAHAVIIGVEQFDYPDGSIATGSGGQLWNRRNQNPGPGYTAGRSDWDGSAAVANGRLTTNNSAAEREYNGPGEGLPISTDEGLGAISAFNNGALSFQFKTVYYRVTFTTGPRCLLPSPSSLRISAPIASPSDCSQARGEISPSMISDPPVCRPTRPQPWRPMPPTP